MPKNGLLGGGGQRPASGGSGLDLSTLFSRDPGGFLPARGSKEQLQDVNALVQSALQSSRGSGVAFARIFVTYG